MAGGAGSGAVGAGKGEDGTWTVARPEASERDAEGARASAMRAYASAARRDDERERATAAGGAGSSGAVGVEGKLDVVEDGVGGQEKLITLVVSSVPAGGGAAAEDPPCNASQVEVGPVCATNRDAVSAMLYVEGVEGGEVARAPSDVRDCKARNPSAGRRREEGSGRENDECRKSATAMITSRSTPAATPAITPVSEWLRPADWTTPRGVAVEELEGVVVPDVSVARDVARELLNSVVDPSDGEEESECEREEDALADGVTLWAVLVGVCCWVDRSGGKVDESPVVPRVDTGCIVEVGGSLDVDVSALVEIGAGVVTTPCSEVGVAPFWTVLA
ncbi:uncharacterized protein BXZ73DRAFT_76993 [Epithele typhae]|uniref:uncharacterized protein n=1 Tax=Epithele typhae TaxID=378194 RepID=UPI0020086AE0|nr:uncharacterized protein BXZ73DRAFT_76993 [Epithele typhae]KAH9934511.1 hypothetical protein BXZ73DRAFT_76993 [Epithele typhae]